MGEIGGCQVKCWRESFCFRAWVKIRVRSIRRKFSGLGSGLRLGDTQEDC
jgi:hypothetical protein